MCVYLFVWVCSEVARRRSPDKWPRIVGSLQYHVTPTIATSLSHFPMKTYTLVYRSILHCLYGRHSICLIVIIYNSVMTHPVHVSEGGFARSTWRFLWRSARDCWATIGLDSSRQTSAFVGLIMAGQVSMQQPTRDSCAWVLSLTGWTNFLLLSFC